ncbi:MAG: hypothetical protein WC254_05345 [Candidatus Woesearchaeota archaeon]|jgi:hypothetical protein
MRNQLQYTTLFVIILVLVLGGSLYFLNTPGSNQLTSAAIADSIDCSYPLAEDVSVEEKEMYNKLCDSQE